MANRFHKYQESLKKFIISNSVINNYKYKDDMIKLISDDEFDAPIILLTIMKGQITKNKIKLYHGYEMATGIELLILLFNILSDEHKLSENINKKITDTLRITLFAFINECFYRNIDMMPEQYFNNDEISCIKSSGINHLYNKINELITSIIDFKIPEHLDQIGNTDLYKFHFSHNYSLREIQTIKQLPKDIIIKFITTTFGNICKLTMILSWILGGSNLDMIDNLERIGYHFGLVLKIAYDFKNLDRDMDIAMKHKYSTNYVINMGIQDAFETFDTSKHKFIEGLLTLEIESSTIKEVIDMLDKRVNVILDNSSPDVKQSASSSVC